jgi:oligopeptide transport system ATP-binding protein
MENNEVLLKVEHLCQYFRLGHRDMKAVDDVSFEIKKGESFGLVGESGCGKTTTGRSIIKLYNITSGNVYFKGQRIGAGIRSYKDAIAVARSEARKKIKELQALKKVDAAKVAEIDAEISKIKAELAEVVSKNRALIRDAKLDSTEVDRQHSEKLVAELDAEYSAKINDAGNDEEKLKALRKEYKNRRRVAKKSKLITQIQMIFQDPIASLDPRMTVRDIIAEGLIVNGVTDKEYINNKVYEILEMVGLVREHADRYPHEFSGGQRQRIGIARAVVMQPEMIIADEPISALDVSIQAQVINLLNDLRTRLGLTVMFIAHDLSVVKYFSDRIGVMYFGKMVELASSEELFKNPLHPYTKSLLSAIPLPDPIYEKQRVRIPYNPIAEHDYSVDAPSFREIAPEHFVYCNDAEEEKYKQIVNNNN